MPPPRLPLGNFLAGCGVKEMAKRVAMRNPPQFGIWMIVLGFFPLSGKIGKR